MSSIGSILGVITGHCKQKCTVVVVALLLVIIIALVITIVVLNVRIDHGGASLKSIAISKLLKKVARRNKNG